MPDSTLRFLDISSPIATLRIAENAGAIVSISFHDEPVAYSETDSLVLRQCAMQLREYFSGTRTAFSVPVHFSGTEFQQRIWNRVAAIPFGKTQSYLELALASGNKNLIRAVGGANGANKLPLLIPCHRVIGKNGNLTGYAGGLWRKQWLLDFEKLPAQPQLFSTTRSVYEKN